MKTRLFGKLAAFLTIVIVAFPLSASDEPEFKLDGQALTIDLTHGKWDGKYTFPDVYCATYPMPAKAISLRQSFYNGKTTYLVDVTYPDKLIAAIAVSTVPAGQNAKDAVAKILINESNNEISFKKSGLGYKVGELSTDFGRAISVVATNPAEGNQNEPFPLSRTLITNPPSSQPVVSMSVHRMFVRGHDRFEVAAYQLVSQPTSSSTKAETTTEMSARLAAVADKMVRSLQQCTAAIPVRAPK